MLFQIHISQISQNNNTNICENLVFKIYKNVVKICVKKYFFNFRSKKMATSRSCDLKIINIKHYYSMTTY